MYRPLPPLAAILGAAGLLPFVVLGIASVGANSGRAAVAATLLVAYGAAILSFLGGVHWGFTLGGDDEADPATRHRLALGVVPPLLGWGAVALAVVAYPFLGLGTLIFSFGLTVIVESRAHKRDWMPTGYMTMRWAISIAVMAILVTVFVLRMVGAHVLF